MTATTTQIVTAAIFAVALASAVTASPASAAPVFPSDLAKATHSSSNSSQCAASRFGCSIGHR
jgi:hypothetical protein